MGAHSSIPSIRTVAALFLAAVCCGSVCAQLAEISDRSPSFSAEQTSFFEKEVQPILKARCLKCHGEGPKIKGGFRLDSREAILRGGELGPAVSLGEPEESLLLPGDPLRRARDAARGQAARRRDRRPHPVGQGGPAVDRTSHAAGRSLPPIAVRSRRAGESQAARTLLVAPPGRPAAGPGGEEPAAGAATRSTRSSWPGSRPKACSPAARGRSRDPDPPARPTTSPGCRPRPRRSTPSSPIDRPTPTSAWSTACSPRPSTARRGAGTGSTWSATPRPTATSATRPSRSPGGIAIT